jgi:mRNA interferase HicA
LAGKFLSLRRNQRATFEIMKCKEFHKIVCRQGWKVIRQRGSHVIYEKDGVTVAVPDHGSKEMPEGLRQKLIKEMKL